MPHGGQEAVGLLGSLIAAVGVVDRDGGVVLLVAAELDTAWVVRGHLDARLLDSASTGQLVGRRQQERRDMSELLLYVPADIL
jgi:hypothetical protein